jgi:hypothetical protein
MVWKEDADVLYLLGNMHLSDCMHECPPGRLVTIVHHHYRCRAYALFALDASAKYNPDFSQTAKLSDCYGISVKLIKRLGAHDGTDRNEQKTDCSLLTAVQHSVAQ